MAAKLGEDKASTAVEHVEYADSTYNRKHTDISILEKLDNESGSLPHDEDKTYNAPPTTARDLVTEILLVEDDPTLVSTNHTMQVPAVRTHWGGRYCWNPWAVAQLVLLGYFVTDKNFDTHTPWTFRMWFIGIGISIFAAYVIIT
jgi:hypothetical protein